MILVGDIISAYIVSDAYLFSWCAILLRKINRPLSTEDTADFLPVYIVFSEDLLTCIPEVNVFPDATRFEISTTSSPNKIVIGKGYVVSTTMLVSTELLNSSSTIQQLAKSRT